MKAVAAAAGLGIVQWKLEIVVAHEPIESRAGCSAPAAVAGGTVSPQARRDRAGGLDWLLIEAGLYAILAIETLRADRNEMTADFVPLRFHQPIQSFQTGQYHALAPAGRTHEYQSFGQPGIAVGHHVLKPLPVRTPDRLIHIEQSLGQRESHVLGVAILAIGMEVLLNSEQRIGAGPRAIELENRRQRKLEQTPGRASQ